MKKKYGAITTLVMAQLSMSAIAADADGIITVSGTVTPTTCSITAPNFSFGTVTFHDVINAGVTPHPWSVAESNAVTIQCTDDIRASSLVFTGPAHSEFSDRDLALTNTSDGVSYVNGVVSYMPRIHTPDTPDVRELQTILGVTFPSLGSSFSDFIYNGQNLITSSGTGAFGTDPVVIRMYHRLHSRGRDNSGTNQMPAGNYTTTMNISMTY